MVSSINVGTVITDYSWSEKSRPIVTIDEDQKDAHIQIGFGWDVCPIEFDIVGSSKEDLLSQLEGWRDIFGKAVEVLKRP